MNSSNIYCNGEVWQGVWGGKFERVKGEFCFGYVQFDQRLGTRFGTWVELFNK